MSEIIRVGMAEFKTCKSPNGVTTLGLGSCVGIALRDPITKIGGLVHIMLPDSTQIKNNGNAPKFADTGIKELMNVLVKEGANRNRIVAKIAGGAQMFKFQNRDDLVRVGERNIEASKKVLKDLKIPLLAEDTGKTYGRTVTFYPETGDFVIKVIGKELSVI